MGLAHADLGGEIDQWTNLDTGCYNQTMTNPTIEPSIEFSEAAIFSRLLDVENSDDLSPELAKHILSLKLSPRDDRRFDELLPKAQSGSLSAEEQAELDNLNHVADVLSLWHSKARRALRQ
jgi:hypothetical protein